MQTRSVTARGQRGPVADDRDGQGAVRGEAVALGSGRATPSVSQLENFRVTDAETQRIELKLNQAGGAADGGGQLAARQCSAASLRGWEVSADTDAAGRTLTPAGD